MNIMIYFFVFFYFQLVSFSSFCVGIVVKHTSNFVLGQCWIQPVPFIIHFTTVVYMIVHNIWLTWTGACLEWMPFQTTFHSITSVSEVYICTHNMWSTKIGACLKRIPPNNLFEKFICTKNCTKVNCSFNSNRIININPWNIFMSSILIW